jgi:hypothetical protein
LLLISEETKLVKRLKILHFQTTHSIRPPNPPCVKD